MVEGDQNLVIDHNKIQGNTNGIVLLYSDGEVDKNTIYDNENGMFLLGETVATIKNNTIESNKVLGIDIRDPSDPILENNIVHKNVFQFKMDKSIRKKFLKYKEKNPKISGPNDMPQGLRCAIF